MTVTCLAGVAEEHIRALDRRAVVVTTGSNAGLRTHQVGNLTVLSTWKQDKRARRTATILTVSLVFGLNVVFAFIVHSAFPALRFTPQGDGPRAVAKARAASVLDVARRTGRTPAEVVVSLVLAAPPVLPSGAVPVTALQGVPSSPVDLVCGTRSGPGPVTAAGRGWTVANGSQVTNFRAGYTVTVSAFGAGQGAVAFRALAGQVNEHCANKSGTAHIVASTGAAGVDAATVWVNRSGGATTAFFWRRGDVVAMVATTGPSAPMGLVKEYDARIAAALAGVCVNADSTVSDGTRSPYVNKAGFTGLTLRAPVGLPADIAPPPPMATQALVILPAVKLPVEPDVPFWPLDLPSPVPAPRAPAIPAFPALTTTAPVRVQDEQGPGCGWSFTGQPVPAFDAAAAASDAAADAETAATALAAKVTSYTAEVPAYQAAYTSYLADVRAFQSYAQAVDTVAAAWDVIRVGQAQYKDAMVLYAAAVAASDAFLAQQSAATATYDSSVAACAGSTPTSPPPTPGSTGSPTLPAPTVSPAPPDTVCPPVPAPIMSQPAPTVPPSPTPPADPRPTP